MRLESHSSNLIDYNQPLSFVFNNKTYKGFKGDTLASALIANDVIYYARSFKYGRKRGIIGAGVEEPNALVSLEIGGRYTPNMKATEVMLYNGLSAVSSSNPNFIDFRAMIKPLHRFMPAGFYYKTFINQKVWSIVEDRLRSLSGFSKAPSETDEDVYDHIFQHAEVLVIGGGAAGMSSALEVLTKSKNNRVILVDERENLGGELTNEFATDESAALWHQETKDRLLGKNEIFKIIKIMADLGVSKIRFTGGEPLIRKDLIDLIYFTSKKTNIDSIHLTTNGVLLPEYIEIYSIITVPIPLQKLLCCGI